MSSPSEATRAYNADRRSTSSAPSCGAGLQLADLRPLLARPLLHPLQRRRRSPWPTDPPDHQASPGLSAAASPARDLARALSSTRHGRLSNPGPPVPPPPLRTLFDNPLSPSLSRRFLLLALSSLDSDHLSISSRDPAALKELL